jgi:hypothetical protein
MAISFWLRADTGPSRDGCLFGVPAQSSQRVSYVISLYLRPKEINELAVNTADAWFAAERFGCIAAWSRAAQAMFAVSARGASGRRCDEAVQGTDIWSAVTGHRFLFAATGRRAHLGLSRAP